MDSGRSIRLEAKDHVVCHLPAEWAEKYQRLRKEGWFEWFIPWESKWAMLKSFLVSPQTNKPASGDPFAWGPSAWVLYLSPVLEKHPLGVAVGIVAHELAHVLLEHDPRAPIGSYEDPEKAAWDLARHWGYEKEVESAWEARRALGLPIDGEEGDQESTGASILSK